jgi:protocatechuate 3,4-dioxygenase beta subunit
VLTPRQSRGPFYPSELPLDQDNDLVHVQGRSVPARGEVVVVRGRVLDEQGRPAAHSRVEIWQCDANGRYHHPRDRRNAPLDENFQGYGRSRTGAEGGYRFRTIQPVAYPGRAPHIHFTIRGPGFEPLVTQMYVEGAPENDRDWILNRVRDPARRASIVVPFEPHPDLPEQRVARFDIVLG